MTGGGSGDEIVDQQLFESIRDAYRDVRLPVPLSDIQRHQRRTAKETVMAARMRVVVVAAVAVMVVTVGTWLLLARGGGSVGPLPANPSTTTSPATPGKPPRPSSSAATYEGTCADYGRAALSPSASPLGETALPLRLTLGQDQTRLLIYATDGFAMTCWLSGNEVVVGGSPTAVNATAYPPGRLSYSSEDSGRGWGGVAFGRVPAGTTRVTISFPSGPDAEATVAGEWFGYFAPPGPGNDRLAEATVVTAVTPTGNLSQPIQHG